MASETLNDIWSRACGEIRVNIPEVSFNTWIASIVPQDVVEDRIILVVQNGFYRNMITERYLELINNAINAVTGHVYKVELYLANEATPKSEEKAANQQEQKSDNRPFLNPKYTFETFVVGNSNRFAQAAALAVAEAPAGAYNPFFLYGGVGLGKTHLMHAIGHFMLRANPNIKLLYTTSENFTNEVISAIQNNRNSEFRERYREVDVLMIDDIQFIAGKVSTQEEFFHTFNQLHGEGKQIIISSDRPPHEIQTLEERLRSRFEGGLMADIQKPDFETRMAILRQKANQEHIKVSDDVVQFIAEKLDSSIRELEGALTRVAAYSSLSDQPISLETTEEALQNILPVREPKRITPELIMQTVSDFYGVKMDDMLSSRRNHAITLPRQIAMYLIREMTDLSLPRIGDHFGGRDHTTVIHACDKIKESIESDRELRSTVNDLRKAINEK